MSSGRPRGAFEGEFKFGESHLRFKISNCVEFGFLIEIILFRYHADVSQCPDVRHLAYHVSLRINVEEIVLLDLFRIMV